MIMTKLAEIRSKKSPGLFVNIEFRYVAGWKKNSQYKPRRGIGKALRLGGLQEYVMPEFPILIGLLPRMVLIGFPRDCNGIQVRLINGKRMKQS
jgi:hypothetical protein